MKAALDASPLVESTGGISRYTTQLAAALGAAFPADEFALLAPPRTGRWWSTGLPRALRRGQFDVFHGTDFAVPYLPVTASVMTIHDLSPWRAAWRGETSPRVRRRTPWLLRLGLATIVITPTEAIRREAIAEFRLKPERVRAVAHGVDQRFHPQPDAPVRDHLLIVATQGKRKNIETATAAAHKAGVDLWVAGRGEWPGGAVPGVRYLGPVADAELPALYAGAMALLFPSHYEGFGLPMLEAMACATPVIASKDPALVEVSGGAALHCDAADVGAWAQAITAIRARRAEWSSRARARAVGFTWEATARRTYEVYEEAIRWRHQHAR